MRIFCLAIDFAPAHLIKNQQIQNLSHIKLIYIGKRLTDKLQPLDHAFIACPKNVRPEVGEFCWDSKIYKVDGEAEEPEEMINARVEIEEESMLKLTEGFDQMHIEDDVEVIEEDEFIILEEVPDVQIISEERAEKTKVQSKITSFFTEK